MSDPKVTDFDPRQAPSTWNSHVTQGMAQPATSAAGLKAATATVASVVTVLAADLLTAGKAVLAANPRKVTFATAGATPADAPANVVITGTDVNDAVISETLSLAQTAATVTSVNRYKTITSLVYPAADGTGATIAVGYTESAAFAQPFRKIDCTADSTVVFELPDGFQVSRAMVAGDTLDSFAIVGWVSSSGTVQLFR